MVRACIACYFPSNCASCTLSGTSSSFCIADILVVSKSNRVDAAKKNEAANSKMNELQEKLAAALAVAVPLALPLTSYA